MYIVDARWSKRKAATYMGGVNPKLPYEKISRLASHVGTVSHKGTSGSNKRESDYFVKYEVK